METLWPSVWYSIWLDTPRTDICKQEIFYMCLNFGFKNYYYYFILCYSVWIISFDFSSVSLILSFTVSGQILSSSIELIISDIVLSYSKFCFFRVCVFFFCFRKFSIIKITLSIFLNCFHIHNSYFKVLVC